jgi:hypothetical protein
VFVGGSSLQMQRPSHRGPRLTPSHGGRVVHTAGPISGGGCRIFDALAAGAGGAGVEEIHLETVALRPTVLKGLAR